MRTRTYTLLKILLLLTTLVACLGSANAPVKRITWEVLDSDYLERTILIKDTVGIEGRHLLKLPFGASMPFRGQWCDGFRDGSTYAIKLGGEWYFWR